MKRMHRCMFIIIAASALLCFIAGCGDSDDDCELIWEAESWNSQSGGMNESVSGASEGACLGGSWGGCDVPEETCEEEWVRYEVLWECIANSTGLRVKFSDAFDGMNSRNVLDVYIDAQYKGVIVTGDTGGWDSFEWSEYLHLSNLIHGYHVVELHSDGGEGNFVRLDKLEFYADPAD